MIRESILNDAAGICEIYNHYVENTTVTFEETAVLPEEMKERIDTITSAYPWLVYEDHGHLLGYAYANRWSERAAYRHSVETTVYVHKDAFGRGIGTALYKELLTHLKNKGFHTAIGRLALPNQSSIALHEKLGFQKVGHIKEAGFKFNQWIDVGYWQLIV